MVSPDVPPVTFIIMRGRLSFNSRKRCNDMVQLCHRKPRKMNHWKLFLGTKTEDIEMRNIPLLAEVRQEH